MFRSSLLAIAGLCLGLGLSSVSAVAAPDPQLRIASVDMQKALIGSKSGSEAQKKYEEEVKKSQAQLDEKKKSFEAQKQEFDKQAASLNEKARAEREEKLRGTEKELRRSFADLQDKLRRTNGQLVGDLVKKIREIVERIGKEEGYTLVLEKGSPALLYADSQVDLTDRVIKEFDATTK